MDPLHLCIALGPLASYLLLIGLINLSRRPFLTTGGRDLAALCVAVSGLAVVGPMDLFMPEAAVNRFGQHGYPWCVWPLLLLLYVLLVTFVVLMTRPRLIIYNITTERLRPILAELVAELDAEARWAGDSLMLPKLGVQLHVESFPTLRNVQLVASGAAQNYTGWRRLERALIPALREIRTTRNPHGYGFVLLGVLVAATLTFWILRQPHAEVVHALKEMLRL